MIIRGIGRSLLALVLLFACAGSAAAQDRVSIGGKLTDESGGVLPGVTVTVTGTGLPLPRVAVTSVTGAYQFPNLAIGTYTVTFELQSFKTAVRKNILIVAGFNAPIDQVLEVGPDTMEPCTAAPLVVDPKRTITGATFDVHTLEHIPTARDPWMIVYMTPGVQLSGTNVGGSGSGGQPTISSRGTTANVQWNLDGGATTDVHGSASASYYNFDSLAQIEVINGGGDVSVQSSGVSINLITKSGSNLFKGSVVGTLTNDRMQFQNVSEELFKKGTGGFLSGAPLNRVSNVTFEYGGPILLHKLWFWGNADHQDINAAVLNDYDASKGAQCAAYADAQRLGTLAGSIAYGDLDTVRNCLHNDRTVIYHVGGKITGQLNQANRLQYLIQGDDKVQNSRGASATTARDATNRQFSDDWHGFPQPTHSLTHEYIASSRLVFNSIYTYVYGGWTEDYQDVDRCGTIRYNGSSESSDYTRADPDCLWNRQPLTLRTTGFRSRSSLFATQRVRPTHDVKTGGAYFLSDKLGGYHLLKFGLGYRRAPSTTYSHYSGGALAYLQCNGNLVANCSDNRIAPGTPGPGLVPYRAELNRDALRNSSWWSYNGYLQDSFTRGDWTVKGGLRYDWQHSKYEGGCVPENVVRPDLLPAQCEDATQSGINPNTGQVEKIRPFGNLSPRVSVTYDLFGKGTTALKAGGSYYYKTRETLADNLSVLSQVTRLTFGSNNTNGTCTGTSCWTDANMDGVVQANELTGVPTSSSARFNTTTGVLAPAGNSVDTSAKISRTREAVVGLQHALMANIAVGIDYIYRKYDRGLATYTVGYQPGSAGYPLSQIYTGPLTYRDPISGHTAEYYAVKPGAMGPSGAGSVTFTNPNYQIYHGLDITVRRHYHRGWQLAGAVTIQDNPQYFPEGSPDFVNPTGRTYQHGVSTLAKYVVKLNGSYDLPWGVQAAGNFNMFHGGARTLTMNGPGDVYGGVDAAGADTTISYATLEFQSRDGFRFRDTKMLDLGLQKKVAIGSAGHPQLQIMLDLFNVFNAGDVLSYASGNVSLPASNAPASIIPPRVLRIGARMKF